MAAGDRVAGTFFQRWTAGGITPGAMASALGGALDGVPRETGFDITPASEVMAALCLAEDAEDLRKRLMAEHLEIPPTDARLDDVDTTFDEVDTVFFTHCHPDHVAWSMVEDEGRARFPSARYLLHQRDWDEFTGRNPVPRYVDRFVRPLDRLEVLDLLLRRFHLELLLRLAALEEGGRRQLLGIADDHRSPTDRLNDLAFGHRVDGVVGPLRVDIGTQRLEHRRHRQTVE